MTKYEVTEWSTDIKTVECVRETPKKLELLNVRGRKEMVLKKSGWRSYYDTFDEAKEAVVKREKANVSSAKHRLEQAREKLKEAIDI